MMRFLRWIDAKIRQRTAPIPPFFLYISYGIAALAIPIIWIIVILGEWPDIHGPIMRRDAAELQAALAKWPGLLENKSKMGETPLFKCVGQGDVWAVRELIRHGADVNFSMRYPRQFPMKDDTRTVLQHAAESGNVEIAKMLLTAGAEINATTVDGDTALDLAQKRNASEMAKLLRDFGGKRGIELP